MAALRLPACLVAVCCFAISIPSALGRVLVFDGEKYCISVHTESSNTVL